MVIYRIMKGANSRMLALAGVGQGQLKISRSFVYGVEPTTARPAVGSNLTIFIPEVWHSNPVLCWRMHLITTNLLSCMKLIYQLIEYWRHELKSFGCSAFRSVVRHGKILMKSILRSILTFPCLKWFSKNIYDKVERHKPRV